MLPELPAGGLTAELVAGSSVAVLILLSVLCFAIACDHLRGYQRTRRRLQQYGMLPLAVRRSFDEVEGDQPPRPVVHRLGAPFVSTRRRQRLREDIVRAGLAERMTPEEFVGLRLLAATAGLALGGLVALSLPPGTWAVALLTGVLGYLLPLLVLRLITRRRLQIINRALPNMLDMLTACLEAGMGFDSAVALLSERTRGELTNELRRFLAEIWLGRTRREALNALVERTHSAGIGEFVRAVVQADELGVGLARTLRSQAQLLRTQQRQRAEEQARKVPIKLLFPLVLCIFPVLMIVVMGPAVLRALALLEGK